MVDSLTSLFKRCPECIPCKNESSSNFLKNELSSVVIFGAPYGSWAGGESSQQCELLNELSVRLPNRLDVASL